MATTALSFHATKFDIVDRNNQSWLRSPQIEVALGYTKAGAVNQLYDRNKDEFTDSMTALVDLDTNGGKQQVRIFSLRGCHLLAMFARTKVAKEFRKWVLDVLEHHTQTQYGLKELQEPPTITKAQQGILYNKVVDIAAGRGQVRTQIWSRFQNHFKLNSYKNLPADQFEEALAYLKAKEYEYGNGVEMLYISDVELSILIDQRVKAIEGELLDKAEQLPHSHLDDPEYLKASRTLIMDYVDSCIAAVISVGAKAPEWPELNQQVIDGLIAERLMSSRMLLRFDNDFKMRLSSVPRDSCIVSPKDPISLQRFIKEIVSPDLMNVVMESASQRMERYIRYLKTKLPTKA